MIRTEGMTQAAMDNDTMVAQNMTDVETAINIAHTFVEEEHRPAAIRRIAAALADARHQSGRTGAGERETVARVIHQCLRPVNMANADWDSGAILGADNSWRRSVYSTADHILAALSQSTAGEDGA